MKDSRNVKGPAHVKKAEAKNLVELEQDEPFFEELEVTEKLAVICSRQFTRPAMVTHPAAYKTLEGSLNWNYFVKPGSNLFSKNFHVFSENVAGLINLFHTG